MAASRPVSGDEVSTPLQSTTETKTLTSDWKRHSMTATAPMGGPNPEYSQRILFKAALGSTVHVNCEWLGAEESVPFGRPSLLLLCALLAAAGCYGIRPRSA